MRVDYAVLPFRVFYVDYTVKLFEPGSLAMHEEESREEILSRVRRVCRLEAGEIDLL